MSFTLQAVRGQRFVEGAPGRRIMGRVADVTTVIEACFDNQARSLLLYPENLTERFFDLSSGEAGEILQKLRNYHIRLAVVRTPSLRLSSRFGELMADEQRGSYFRLFDQRSAAEEWLVAAAQA
jgi:hypothetical protein